jgi:hypothetical protein
MFYCWKSKYGDAQLDYFRITGTGVIGWQLEEAIYCRSSIVRENAG